MGRGPRVWGVATFACLALVAFAARAQSAQTMQVYYVEVVTQDVAQTCAALEQIHGVEFGEMVPDLGNARVAERANGTLKERGLYKPLTHRLQRA